jgi:4a-hydroxytetrahydrobiopterin dehydratase
MGKLSVEDVEKEVAGLTGWLYADESLQQTFVFKDFKEAFAFMTAVAAEAENANHHPDWSNSWNKVIIRLSSHDVGGVTERDIALAEKINKLAGQ